jgi:hypothetical protein
MERGCEPVYSDPHSDPTLSRFARPHFLTPFPELTPELFILCLLPPGTVVDFFELVSNPRISLSEIHPEFDGFV